MTISFDDGCSILPDVVCRQIWPENLVTQDPLSTNDDDRRVIVDLFSAVREGVGARISMLTAQKDGCVVGNHFHDCVEEFLLLTGCIERLEFFERDSGDRREWVNLPPGTRITVPWGVVHTLRLAAGSVLFIRVFSNVPPSDKSFYKPWVLFEG